ncbi:hypothetical protein ACFWGI_35750 [Streptomyces niveus]|uniref:hypothetical protein n=1 Tax=Streptomyces niveus TaxID=193462 RepID=UPI00365C9552
MKVIDVIATPSSEKAPAVGKALLIALHDAALSSSEVSVGEKDKAAAVVSARIMPPLAPIASRTHLPGSSTFPESNCPPYG